MSEKQNRSIILNADQLRKLKPEKEELVSQMGKNEIYIILDDVLDTYNIGSVFRLSDAVSVKKIYLCGGTETPPNSRIKKSSINTTEVVEWEYCETTEDAINKLRKHEPEIKIVAIEQAENSVRYDKYDYPLPIALIVGNESFGVSEQTLKFCDAVVEMPMFGINVSLNVMVSLGIILYQVIEVNHLGEKVV